MAALGFSPGDFGDDVTGVWPENWEIFNAFLAVSTQWRNGMAGPTGLCYEAIYPLLNRTCKTDEQWDDVFSGIRIMEDEALKVMHEKP